MVIALLVLYLIVVIVASGSWAFYLGMTLKEYQYEYNNFLKASEYEMFIWIGKILIFTWPISLPGFLVYKTYVDFSELLVCITDFAKNVRNGMKEDNS